MIDNPIITACMMHEMEAHLPFAIKTNPERWEWMATWLNHALAHPGVPCPCCSVTPTGDVYDHLTQEQIEAMQPNTRNQPGKPR